MCQTFYRDRLRSRQAKGFYDGIYQSIQAGNLEGVYTLPITNAAKAEADGVAALRALQLDRPELFFIDGTVTTVFQGEQLTLLDDIRYTPRQIEKIRAYLERALAEYTLHTFGLSDWERERIVYQRVARSLSYMNHAKGGIHKDYDHNIVGPVLQGSGVCEGFSCLLVLALRKAGIPCIRVNGYCQKEYHTWNIAWVDGSPVHLDVTWEHVNPDGSVGFWYFNLTDEQIGRDHRVDGKGFPQCEDPTLGYHFRTGAVFSSSLGANRYLKRVLAEGGSASIRISAPGDLETFVSRAMAGVTARGYRYSYNNAQRAVQIQINGEG